jgi:hypothetical protein
MARMKAAFLAREVPAEQRSTLNVVHFVPVNDKNPDGKMKMEIHPTRCLERQFDVTLPRGNRVRMTEAQMEHAGLDPRNPARVPPVLELVETGDELSLAD